MWKSHQKKLHFSIGYVGQTITKHYHTEKDFDLLKQQEVQIKKPGLLIKWVGTFLDGTQPASDRVA